MADTLPGGCQLWRDWHTVIAPGNAAEIQALDADQGRYLGYVRVAARRTSVPLEEPITAVSTAYVKQPLLRA